MINNVSVTTVLAILAGSSIALQSALNSHLGVVLKNSLMATTIAFMFSGLFTLSALLLLKNQSISLTTIESVPFYLWFTGALFSAFAVSVFFYLAPKIGIGPLMSYGLGGQIVMAIIISHFGWFDLPVKPITVTKIVGVIVLIIGILLINTEP